MTYEQYLALFFAMFIVAVIPGPAVFAVTSASVVGGFQRGAFMTLGIVLADYVFIVLAISGLSYVAELMGDAFILIKYLCAAYLIWLGISIFIAKDSAESNQQQTLSKQSAILSGFLLSISNPKAIVFYLALFPAFVDIENIQSIDVLGIMAMATLAFAGVNLGYGYLGAQARKLVASSNKLSLLNKCAGTVIAATGITLAVRA